MLRTHILAALLFTFCAPALAQDNYRVTAEYDRFKDVTTYGLEAMKTSDSTTFFFALFQCPGQQPCRPEGVIFGFALVALDGDPYQGQGIARMIRDGARQEPYKLKYAGLKTRLILLPAHVFVAQLKPDGLAKIANSTSVEYQIDNLEFQLSRENLAGLRDLASRMKSE